MRRFLSDGRSKLVSAKTRKITTAISRRCLKTSERLVCRGRRINIASSGTVKLESMTLLVVSVKVKSWSLNYFSRRHWDGMVKVWKRNLHRWDKLDSSDEENDDGNLVKLLPRTNFSVTKAEANGPWTRSENWDAEMDEAEGRSRQCDRVEEGGHSNLEVTTGEQRADVALDWSLPSKSLCQRCKARVVVPCMIFGFFLGMAAFMGGWFWHTSIPSSTFTTLDPFF